MQYLRARIFLSDIFKGFFFFLEHIHKREHKEFMMNVQKMEKVY